MTPLWMWDVSREEYDEAFLFDMLLRMTAQIYCGFPDPGPGAW